VQTEQGTLLLPAVKAVSVSATDDARVLRVAAFARFLVDPHASVLSTAGVSVSKFIAQYGTLQLDTGETVAAALAILPLDATYQSAKLMLADLAAREGAALKTAPGESDAIATALGLQPGATIASAPVDRLEMIPSQARIALLSANVGTIGALAA